MDQPAEQPTFLTTREVAALLRVKERKIYALAASGDIPCRRVSGKLLFPRRDVEAWLGLGGGQRSAANAAPLPAVIAGSHDPLLDWAVRGSGAGLATMFDGSLDGLDRVAADEAVACGMHVPEGDGQWNVGHVEAAIGDRPFVLVEWARRSQGLIAADQAILDGGVAGLRGRRVALRQPKSGAAHLFAGLAREAGLGDGDFEAAGPPARTEHEAAALVATGRADAALGLEAMARQFDLAFAPLVAERYDLLVERRHWFEPAMQRLIAFCRTAAFADQAAGFGGYDLAGHGTVHWNGP